MYRKGGVDVRLYANEECEVIPDTMIYCSVKQQDKRIISIDDKSLVIESIDVVQPSDIVQVSVYCFATEDFSDYRLEGFSVEFNNRRAVIVPREEQFQKIIDGINNLLKILRTNKMINNDLSKACMFRECGDYINENNYPYELDSVFADDIDVQLKYWNECAKFEKVIMPKNRFDIAIEIDNYDKYKKFLECSREEFVEEYMINSEWARDFVNAESISRVYLGNEFCEVLFPNDYYLELLLEKSFSYGLGITLMTTYLRENRINQFRTMMKFVSEWAYAHDIVIEVIFNDWGMLNIINQFRNVSPVLGRLLNIRRKDPRKKWGWGYDKCKHLLGRNGLNGKYYSDFLNGMKVYRFEYELTDDEIDIPFGTHSIHFPFYQIGTGVACPMNAICKNHNRYRQNEVTNCPIYCNEFMLLYPKHLNMMGKGNSTFGFNVRSIDNLQSYINSNIDRIVFNTF